ncbi:MAG TPA: hypothetical protein PKB03_08500 [Baekduia sp.]|nr:hypothetical protein [Baekduia sp.]
MPLNDGVGRSFAIGPFLPSPMNDHGPRVGLGGQLSLFQHAGTLPVSGWRGKTPPELRADAPAGYRLDLSGDEPLYVLDDEERPIPPEGGDELFDEDTEPKAGDTDGPDEDDDAVDDNQQWSAPREWAPYCADTIAMKGTIRKPASRLGALWVCTGGSGRAVDRDVRGTSVYRVVPLDAYCGPHPDLPLSNREHNALPDEHPCRWGTRGCSSPGRTRRTCSQTSTWSSATRTSPNPDGHGYLPDPDWHPHDEDAVRSERNPWRHDPHAWQPTRRLI